MSRTMNNNPDRRDAPTPTLREIARQVERVADAAESGVDHPEIDRLRELVERAALRADVGTPRSRSELRRRLAQGDPSVSEATIPLADVGTAPPLNRSGNRGGRFEGDAEAPLSPKAWDGSVKVVTGLHGDKYLVNDYRNGQPSEPDEQSECNRCGRTVRRGRPQ